MLVDRYDPVNLFTQIPGLCLQMEPVLAQLDRLLDDDVLFAKVKQDGGGDQHSLSYRQRSAGSAGGS